MVAALYAFVLCANGLKLHCRFATITWKEPFGAVYSCESGAVTNDGHATHIQNINGSHLSGYINSDVHCIKVRYDQLQLTRLPQGIETFLPNLLIFQWEYGNLASITSDDLQPFPNLQFISLAYNKLTSLDGNLFVHTPKLVEIYFTMNLLENVDDGLLDGLSNLKAANFKGNTCITYFANTEIMRQLKIMLSNQCPRLTTTTKSPLTSTTSTLPVCADELELIKSLRGEILDLKNYIEFFTCPASG